MIIGKGRTEILGDGSVSWAKTPPQDIERDRRSTGAGRRAGDRRASRLARLLAAIAVAIAGTAALVGEQVHVVSNNAVVSSARILIRTPIDGIVTMAPPALGSALAEGAVLARIENPRLSPRRIEELRAELAQVTATEAATRRRRETVAALRTELADRAARHASLVATRVQADIDSAVAVFAGRVAQRDQAWRDLTRRRALATVGVASKADLERAELLFANASLDTAGQAAALRALKVQLDAARQTIFAEQGANDVGYSRQRADDLTVQLAELDETLATLAAEREAKAARLRIEQSEYARDRNATLTVAGPRQIWRTIAHAGEQVSAGAVIAEIVDCRQSVLVASVSQRDVPNVQVGGPARVRLAGERRERPGRVMVVVGEAALAGDLNLAALPAPSGAASAVVVVALAPDADAGQACLIGRTAHAILPLRDPGLLLGLLDRWL